MANSMVGGLAQGLAEGKQLGQSMSLKKQHQAMMQEYYELQKDQIKQQSKLDEMKLTQKQQEFNMQQNMFELLRSRMSQQGQQFSPSVVPQSFSGNAGDFAPLAKYAEEYRGLPPGLISKVIEVESQGNPMAKSPKGALGLMQLMPGTASDLGVKDPFNPTENVMGGSQYLKGLLDRFGGDTRLALAAYNAGPEAVEKHGGVPPYKETQDYVGKILGSGGGLPQQMAQMQFGAGDDPMRDPMTVALLNMAMGGKFNYEPGRVSFQDTAINGQPVSVGFDSATGKPIPGLVIPKPIKYEALEQEQPDKSKTKTWINPHNPPAGVMITPSPLDSKNPVPKEIEDKVITQDARMQTSLGYLGELVSQDPSVLGVSARMKYGAERTPFVNQIQKMTGTEPTANQVRFYQALDDIVGTEVHEFGGSALSAQELKRAIAKLPSSMSNQKNFMIQLKTVLELKEKYKQEMYEYYSKSPRERQEMDKKPKLKLGTPQPEKKSNRLVYDPETDSLQ